MIILMLAFLVISLMILFWISSLLVMQIISSPTVYANSGAIEDCFKLAELKKNQLVVDLGCGDGRSLIIAAKKLGARGIGVDLSPWCYLKANFNVLVSGQRKNIKIVWGNFKKVEADINKADLIYLYLLNATLKNIKLWLFDNIGSNTKVVSLAFWFPNKKPKKTAITWNLGKKTKIYLYTK